MNSAQSVASGPDLIIAGTKRSQEWCVERALAYYVRTLKKYDESPGLPSQGITDDLIRRTRALASRITRAEQAWFVEHGRSLDLSEVARLDDLRQLLSNESAWEAADSAYSHFVSASPKGVSFAKVHKVLHLVRPTVFPILDSRLKAIYRTHQRALADAGRLPGRENWRRRTWLAIAEDLTSATDSGALTSLRDNLTSRAHNDEDPVNGPHVREVAERLGRVSDLRLLDILTWER
ncbi:hypothetical protein C8046_14060 [Serinibacter arcticus]|uniref:Uncharacterized protein n=1 Tax=Serinibacter arcticus TaxID=1655435 RepID=A0A2U1ZXC7_9MICO|nr:DUF6308 family protein [Serinibacter arcticus]PWD51600.1 hypothetical protein C8046_14060 [Serinibacter arcticus]